MTLSLTLILILITAAMTIYAWQNPTVLSRWMFNAYQIARRNEYWRFITSGFVHADWGHLIFNMISLYFFGQLMEQVVGRAYYLVLYLVGIIVSDIPSYMKHRNNPNYNSLGASGGVSAVVFAGIVFFPLNPIYIFFIPIGIPGFLFGLLYMLYSYYEANRGGSYVNHSAHLWGALFGVAFVVILFPGAVPRFFEQVLSYRPF